MIKRKILFLLFLYFINKTYSSENQGTFLEKSIKSAFEKFHELVLSEDTNSITQAEKPLNELLYYLKDITHIPNVGHIFCILQYLKNELEQGICDKDIADQSRLFWFKVSYFKFIYALFELDNKDIKKKNFPIKNVLDDMLNDLHQYALLQSSSFHSTFSGAINYESLQKSITTCLAKLADPNLHAYLDLDINTNIVNPLNMLLKEIDLVELRRDEDEITACLSLDRLYEVIDDLTKMQEYIGSKVFLSSLPFINPVCKTPIDGFIGSLVGENRQFQNNFLYIKSSLGNAVECYIKHPARHVQKVFNKSYWKNTFDLRRTDALIKYVVNPFANTLLSVEIPKNNPSWYDFKGNIKEMAKDKLVGDPLAAVQDSLKRTIHYMQGERNALEIKLDQQSVFDSSFLEEVIGKFYLKLPIHNQKCDSDFSLMTIIFLPYFIINNQNLPNSLHIEDNLKNVINTQLSSDVGQIIIRHLCKFREAYYKDYRDNFNYQFNNTVLPKQIWQDFWNYINWNKNVFIYNSIFYNFVNVRFKEVQKSMEGELFGLSETLKLNLQLRDTYQIELNKDSILGNIMSCIVNGENSSSHVQRKIDTLNKEISLYKLQIKTTVEIIDALDTVQKVVQERI